MWLFFVVLIVSRRHWLLSIEVYVSFGCSSDVEQWRQAVQGAYYRTLVYWLVTTMVTWTGLCCAVQKGSPYRVWGYVNWSAELINFIGFFFFLEVVMWSENSTRILSCEPSGRCKKKTKKKTPAKNGALAYTIFLESVQMCHDDFLTFGNRISQLPLGCSWNVQECYPSH